MSARAPCPGEQEQAGNVAWSHFSEARPCGENGPVTSQLRVILCEPYFSGSHRSWAEGLAAYSSHDIHLVTHPGRFWKWRMHGAPLTLAEDLEGVVASRGRPDLLLVSDMVHVPALLGLARHALAGVPVVVYFHENQLTYPLRDGKAADSTYALTNWLSMAAADQVVFNSEHHRRDVAAALPKLLKPFPDQRHTPYVDEVSARSEVIPVGVDAGRFAQRGRQHDPPAVLWNHRWEYDKDPAAFFGALASVADAGVGFKLIVVGESYHKVPPVFEQARERFSDQLLWFGTAGEDEYPALLGQADIVVSTARHEFFGVAVVEAITAGALPVLPRRLSYPELVPEPGDSFLYDGEGGLVERLCWALTDHAGRRAAAAVARAHVGRFDWKVVAPLYDELLVKVAAGTKVRTVVHGNNSA